MRQRICRPQPPFQIPNLKALQANVWSAFFYSAVQAMIRPGEFGKTAAAFEFGCGTGRLVFSLQKDWFIYYKTELKANIVAYKEVKTMK